MNKIAESSPKLENGQELYIPLEKFHEKVSTIKDNYYQSQLSFKPVFEKFT